MIEKEAVSFQTASGVGYGAGAASQTNQVQGTATTRQTLTNDRQLVGRADAKTMLQSMGVSFQGGASATFWPHSGTLIVRNTQDNLDMVDALVDQANSSAPKQVSIESKFVEINQNNAKELGFDWLLGPFSLNGKVFGSGGTAGNGVPVNSANFPFNANGVPIGQNPVTSGNRSGDFAISANALDALLVPGLGQAAGVAPSMFGLAGVFTNPQFQVVIRALNQKKGIDLLSAPSVTTKSGQRAIIEVIQRVALPEDIHSATGSIHQQLDRKYCHRGRGRSSCCDADDTSRLGDAKYWRDAGSGTGRWRGRNDNRSQLNSAGRRV